MPYGPGFDQLRFCTLLKKVKTVWNTSTVRYPMFWSAENLLLRLKSSPMSWQKICQVRDRLILVLRILMLMRSHDLANMLRTLSQGGGTKYILLKRKGHMAYQWEPVLHVGPSCMPPWHLLSAYVRLNAAQGPLEV